EPWVRAGLELATGAAANKARGALGRSSVLAQAPTQEELANAADAAYTQARQLPVGMDPQSVGQVGRNIKTTLNAEGLLPPLAPTTYGLLKYFDNPANRAKNNPNNGLATIDDVLAVRTALNRARQSAIGRNNPEKAAASIAIDKIDTY